MSKLVEVNPWQALRRFTQARIALGRVGASLPTEEVLQFGLAHAQARDAVWQPFAAESVAATLNAMSMTTVFVHSAAPDRASYLRRPDWGRRLEPESRARLAALRTEPLPDLAFVVADGLSAPAVHRHAVPLLERVYSSLRAEGWRIAPVVIAQQSRVALGDEVGELLGASLVAVLIGERPGLSSPDSLGVYLTHAPFRGRSDANRNCISNVRPEGLSYAAAAFKLAWLAREALARALTGIDLKDESDLALLKTKAARQIAGDGTPE
jgi:ethanolamine ammonia-lyase small subunit